MKKLQLSQWSGGQNLLPPLLEEVKKASAASHGLGAGKGLCSQHAPPTPIPAHIQGALLFVFILNGVFLDQDCGEDPRKTGSIVFILESSFLHLENEISPHPGALKKFYPTEETGFKSLGL